MIIFAAESSGSPASAAALKDGDTVAETFVNNGLTHSETLLPICDETFKKAGITPNDVDYFAVTSGPGSFTGLRIGMALIKGMAFAKNAPCVAVPTLEALAFGVGETDRIILPVLDARRNRVYCAAFKYGVPPERIMEDTVLSLSELKERFRGNRLLLVGDAAEMCYNYLLEDCDRVIADNIDIHASHAARLAEIYIKNGKTVSADALAPVYIQLPQAERELKKKLEIKE